MISEEALIVWMIAMEHQSGGHYDVPTAVCDAFVKRGWCVRRVDNTLKITSLGRAIYDIHGPDYGIETTQEEPVQ